MLQKKGEAFSCVLDDILKYCEGNREDGQIKSARMFEQFIQHLP